MFSKCKVILNKEKYSKMNLFKVALVEFDVPTDLSCESSLSYDNRVFLTK